VNAVANVRRGRRALAGLIVLLLGACTVDRGAATDPTTTLEPVVAGSTLPAPLAAESVSALIGQCRIDASVRARAVSTNEAPTVPCTQPHGLETYAAGPLPSEWGTSPYPVKSTAVYRRLQDAVASICTEEAFDGYYGVRREATDAGVRRPVGAIHTSWFIPSRAAWAAGERWVRCDLRVAWDDPTGSLTASLRGRYDEIAATALGASCVVAGATNAARCDQPHALEGVTQYLHVTGGRPAADGDSSALDAWRTRCRDDALRYLSTRAPAAGFDVDVQVPSAPDWDKDPASRRVTCRAGFKDGDQFIVTVGSIRGLGDRAPRIV
jgi:hypothetical protein